MTRQQRGETIRALLRTARFLVAFGLGTLVGLALTSDSLDELHKVMVGFGSSLLTTGGILWGVYWRSTKSIISNIEAEADSYKDVADAHSQKIEQLEKDLKLIRALVENITKETEAVKEKNKELESEREELKKKNDVLERENNDLRARVTALEKQVHELCEKLKQVAPQTECEVR